MNNETSRKLAGVVELLIESSSRINQAKPQKYWYPLSMATYGVEEIIEALDSMCAFRTSMWEKTAQFEKEFAAYQGAQHAVMVNSGSSADLLLAFWLLDPRRHALKPGDEILIPAVTWPTQYWAAMMAGFKVRLVDVDPATLNIDLEDLKRKISPRTRAIFLVHLMGNPCQMDTIMDLAKAKGLVVLEDCCEALGAEWKGRKVGNFGAGGTFSFFFSHHMTTMEGGMVVCQDEEMAEELKILRAHGWVRNVRSDKFKLDQYAVDPRYAFVNWGFNLRPTEIQAAFGLHQLNRLPEFNRIRAELAGKFYEFLGRSEWFESPRVLAGAQPSWLALPVMVRKEAPFSPKEVTAFLESEGVETRPIVTGNIARHPVAEVFPEFKLENLPGADQIHDRGFYLGLSPVQAPESLSRLIETIERFAKQY